MVRIRLRTKLVFSLIFTTAMLTGVSLLIVQNYLRNHAKSEIVAELPRSLEVFEAYAKQRYDLLRQSAAMSADLPHIRVLMTSNDERTIQDSSEDFWKLTECDLFILANPAGNVMALHSSRSSFDREAARGALARTLS